MRLWALGVSVVIHLVALAGLGVFHFSRRAEASVSLPADISVHAIERAIEQPEPIPKPKIEPPPAPTVKAPVPEPPPLPKLPEIPVPDPVAEPAARPQPVEVNLFFGTETVARRICLWLTGPARCTA